MSITQILRAVATQFFTHPPHYDALEHYLDQSQSHSIADLEYNERQWLRAQTTGNPFMNSF